MILQHPLEVNQAKGSAQLLHLSLANSCLVTGEVFDEAMLSGSTASGGEHRRTQNILLYPAFGPDGVDGTPLKIEFGEEEENAGITTNRFRLIVLDGTWRKSRKMLFLNPWLQKLPRLALRDMPESHYRIRKAHRPDQLSTLEATCAALSQLEGYAERYQPLLAAFDGFVAEQMARRPASHAVTQQVSPPNQ